jgi:hypothetical protein
MKISHLIYELEKVKESHGDIPVAWESGSGYIFGEGQFGVETEVVEHERHDEYEGPELPKVFVIRGDHKALWEEAEKRSLQS